MSHKPIFITGMDFSGTSMLASMFRAAGVDMGDVETAEDVRHVLGIRAIGYRTFEDKPLVDLLTAPALLADFLLNFPYIDPDWLDKVYASVLAYIDERTERSLGKRWGAKSNGLVWLALHPKFHELPVQWVTTLRPLEDVMGSAWEKLGKSTFTGSLVGMQYTAWATLSSKKVWKFAFDDMLRSPEATAQAIFRRTRIGQATNIANVIDPVSKGVLSWHG